MENKKAGNLLAMALTLLTKEVESLMDKDGRVSSTELKQLTKTVIEDMNSEFRSENETLIVHSALNIVLLSLANYSIIERKIFEASNIKCPPSRKAVLDKLYAVMSKGL